MMKRQLSKLILLVLLGALFGFSVISPGNVLYLPLIYDDSPDMPTPAPTPTPAPALWVYPLAAFSMSGSTRIYASVPGIGYDLAASKTDKVISIWAYCPKDKLCILDPIPLSFPPECDFVTGQWCQIDKIILDYDAKQVCGLQFPFNCIDVD
jgi:hypothetical protein